MDNVVLPHEATVARPHVKPQSGLAWSEFFQSLGRSGPDQASSGSPKSVGRFATSA